MKLMDRREIRKILKALIKLKEKLPRKKRKRDEIIGWEIWGGEGRWMMTVQFSVMVSLICSFVAMPCSSGCLQLWNAICEVQGGCSIIHCLWEIFQSMRNSLSFQHIWLLCIFLLHKPNQVPSSCAVLTGSLEWIKF